MASVSSTGNPNQPALSAFISTATTSISWTAAAPTSGMAASSPTPHASSKTPPPSASSGPGRSASSSGPSPNTSPHSPARPTSSPKPEAKRSSPTHRPTATRASSTTLSSEKLQSSNPLATHVITAQGRAYVIPSPIYPSLRESRVDRAHRN